ncbi:MAG: glycosyltransferase family 9 protein [Desulfarculaceae bacterium]
MPAWSERAPSLPEPGPSRRTRSQEVVVVQMARLGDFLQTTPLLAALKSSRPQARLTLLVQPAQAPLARACSYVDQVLTLDPAHLEDAARSPEPVPLRLARIKGLMEPIWSRPADEVINLNLSAHAALAAAGWEGARLRGWRMRSQGEGLRGEPWTPFIMGLVRDRRLTRLHLCDILASYAEPARAPLTRLDYHLDQKALEGAEKLLPSNWPRVALQLGANNDLRRWPLSRFADLARGLMEQGISVVLVGSYAERILGRRLKRELGPGGEDIIDLMGRTGLPDLAGVLAGCELMVSSDTGSLHLATALGVKVLALYMGPAQAHETGPYGNGHLVLQARDQCGPCSENNPSCQGKAPCRRLISAGQALKAARVILEGLSAAEASQRLDLPPGVEPLGGVIDGFGQRYQNLKPLPFSTGTALALALRQAGRVLLRPAFEADASQCRDELCQEHLPPDLDQAKEVAGLARGAEQLRAAAQAGDAPAAGRILSWAPGLRPLGDLVGPEAPPRLAQACQAAAEALAQAACR